MTHDFATAEILAVGSELLGWTRIDTNSLFLTARLGTLGIQVKGKSVVGDDPMRLRRFFEAALDRSDLVVLTGGLGPTADDLTREVVAEALGLPLIEDEAITASIRERFARRSMRMPDLNRRQAMVPRGATVLTNPHGTAPGLFITDPSGSGKCVVLLPGPPRELKPMFEALCEDGALAQRAGSERLHTVSLFTTQRSESHVDEAAQPVYGQWLAQQPPIETTILATPGQIELHLTMRSADAARATARLDAARAELVAALGDAVFSTDGRTLPAVVGDMLRQRTMMIAAAESCTGGLFLERLTEMPGSSDFVSGGVVAYSNALKTEFLGVNAGLIETRGAVSEPVAAAMADGIRERTRAQVNVAITGIAGPGGGTAEKPVGTVVIAVLIEGHPLTIRTCLFPGGRDQVRLQASQTALDVVRRLLQ